jgi:GNAT superfamily N-acetyltransferase
LTRYSLVGPAGQSHTLSIEVNANTDEILVTAVYEGGDVQDKKGAILATWRATYEEPIMGGDLGQLYIGQGRLELEIDELRGIGLGSALMSIIVTWAHQHQNVPVSRILLSKDDALVEDNRKMRNRFWEKFGVIFDYHDGDTWGKSQEMMSHDLKLPEFRLASGWALEKH